MGLTTIKGIAKARWLILVAVAVIALVAASRLAEYQSVNKLTHEAVATVTFKEDLAVPDRGEFEGQVSDQHLLATGVNDDILGDTPGQFLPWPVAEIELLLDQGQIKFIGRGYEQEDADEIVQTMLDRYMASSAQASGAGSIVAELERITEEIAILEQRELDRTATPTLTDAQVEIEAKRAVLETRISSLQGAYGSLGVELLAPVPPRSVSDVQADIDATLEEIIRLQKELLALPPSPTDQIQVDQQAIVDALRRQQLETRWLDLSTQLANIQGYATPSAVVAQEVSAGPSSGMTNQVLAMAAAVVVALMALVGIERTRGIVWSASDVKADTTVLTELPPRGLHTLKRPTTEPWYTSIPGGRRKAAVQLIRSQLDGFRNIVVGFQGTGVYNDDTLDLTTDVAMSAAVTGRTVLLIDATFSERNNRVEFGEPSEVNLGMLLSGDADDPQAAMAEMKAVLTSLPETYRDLRVLRCGIGQAEASDAMAGPRFEMLLDVARELFELVIIAGEGFGEPTSYVLAQRVDGMILVGSIGHTADRDVEAAQRDFKTRRAELMGVVLVRRRRSKLRRWLSPRVRRTLWSVLDKLSPVGNKIKGAFTKDVDDDESGMSGFENTLTHFQVTGESLENLKERDPDEGY